MGEQSGKREFFNEERLSTASLATTVNVSEGETASTGNHSTTIIAGTSNGREHVNLEMEIRSRASIGCCNNIQGCILRTRHSERGVSYHRNSESNASKPTLSESADPGEITNATTAIAEAAQIAAETTDDIAYHIKFTAILLRTQIKMVKDKANRMLRKLDRTHYNFIASNYEEDLLDAEIAVGDAEIAIGDVESACQTAFNAVARVRDAVRELSAATNCGSTETEILEKAAITAIASANRATIASFHKQYLVLQILRKCKIDLITPVFPKCEYERWEFINGRAIVLASIAFVSGCVMFVYAFVDSIRDSDYLMLGIGLALIGMSVAYLLYKLRSCWRKMQARQIRNDDLEKKIEDIDTTLCQLWRHYKSIEIPSIPLNEE